MNMRNPLQLLKGSLELIRENMGLFLGIMVIPAVLSYVVTLFGPDPSAYVLTTMQWVVYWSLTMPLFLLNVLVSISLILAFSDRSMSVVGAYKEGVGQFVRYLLFSLLFLLIIGIAYLLFIIPGIIASVWLAFGVFVLLIERMGIVDSLKRSRAYVKGRWWKVFWRLIGLILISTAFNLIISFTVLVFSRLLPDAVLLLIVAGGNVILTPVTVGYMYGLYMDVKASAATSDSPKMAGTPAYTEA